MSYSIEAEKTLKDALKSEDTEDAYVLAAVATAYALLKVAEEIRNFTDAYTKVQWARMDNG